MDDVKNPVVLCECGAHPAVEPHVCPYGDQIHGDDTLCTCCEACDHECANDI